MSGTKVILLVLGIILVANVAFVMYGSRERRKFKKDGMIVLAAITGQKTIDNHEVISCRFHFKDREYHIEYAPQRIHEPNDSLVFLYILPDNPKEWMQLDKYVVPSCLTTKDVPADGWVELPLKACDDPRFRF